MNEHESPLRKYIAAQDDILTILGPRRVPALSCPTHNTASAISVCTSVGFSQLGAHEYHDAVQILRPDIAVTMADVITAGAASVKRVEKSADRTHAWLRDASAEFSKRQSLSSLPPIFAALPPVDSVQQSLYLQDLSEEYSHLLSGIAVYSANTIIDIPRALISLPRMCLSNPESPHSILSEIALGADLLCVPFVASSSDHGIALTFDFPGQNLRKDVPQPLGVDLWSAVHQTSLLPLCLECDCFTCTRHHIAYIHHLLQAKEMLAWTLLQIHNLATMDRFFEACRRSIAEMTFEEDVKAFNHNYERELPAKTGMGPRVRGYQTMSVGGGEAKNNAKSWGRFDDAVEEMADPVGHHDSLGDSKQLANKGSANKA